MHNLQDHKDLQEIVGLQDQQVDLKDHKVVKELKEIEDIKVHLQQVLEVHKVIKDHHLQAQQVEQVQALVLQVHKVIKDQQVMWVHQLDSQKEK